MGLLQYLCVNLISQLSRFSLHMQQKFIFEFKWFCSYNNCLVNYMRCVHIIFEYKHLHYLAASPVFDHGCKPDHGTFNIIQQMSMFKGMFGNRLVSFLTCQQPTLVQIRILYT